MKKMLEKYEVEKAIERFKKNQYQKQYRINKKIKEMLSIYDENAFLTFTLKNEYINISEKTFIRYIKKVLNKNKKINEFICNLDYGKKNGRLHAHCVISGRPDIKKINKDWGRGAVNIHKINKHNHLAIGKYITKLSKHAIKQTAFSPFRNTNNDKIRLKYIEKELKRLEPLINFGNYHSEKYLIEYDGDTGEIKKTKREPENYIFSRIRSLTYIQQHIIKKSKKAR